MSQDHERRSATFVMTDIEGSTRLWDEAPDAMGSALERHDDIVHATVGTHRGSVVRTKGEGDSAFAVFMDPAAGLACAFELQRALTDEVWPAGISLRVRIAVHSGEAVPRAGDYYGGDVNRAARLRAAAHGGQLVVSDRVREKVGNRLPLGVSLRDLGLHRLRDLSRPERIWQVVHTGLPEAFPPLRTLDARGHNLPFVPTSFVGRDDECISIAKRIRNTPLVTLVGPGGIGKTRLALQSAATAIDAFGDGVWFVELGSLDEGALVAPRVAEALGLREEPGKPMVRTIGDHLVGRRLLLLLDTCEHLLDAVAGLCAELLGACEELHVLATSRQPLGVYGEAVVDVGPLPAPPPGAPPEEIATTPSAQLFLDRAALVDEGFVFDGQSAPHVASICRRVEGIPLAVELAAALVRTDTIASVAGKLRDRLGSLVSGPRTVPERQRTMRATVAWSVDLLDDAQRSLFSSLAVFAEGFTADMASALNEGDTRSVLEELHHRSLLRIDEERDRFTMADTVREYAYSLLSSNEIQRLSSGLVGIVADLLVAADAEGTEGFDRIGVELDNARAALRFSIDEGDADPAVEIAGALARFWAIRGHLSEGRQWLGELIAKVPDGHARRARLLHQAGSLAYAQGDHEGSAEQLSASRDAARVAGDEATAAASLSLLAAIEVQVGRAAEAGRMAEASLEVLRRTGPSDLVARALTIVALAANASGDPSSARAAYEEVLVLARSEGSPEGVARALINLGTMAFERADPDDARARLEEALPIVHRIGDSYAAAVALITLALVEKDAGAFDRAASLAEESLAVREELGDRRGIAVCLQNLADLRRLQGRFEEARVTALRAMHACREIGFVAPMIDALETLASVDFDEDRLQDSLRLFAAADAARSDIGSERSAIDEREYERCLSGMRQALGEDTVARAAAGAEDMESLVVSMLD